MAVVPVQDAGECAAKGDDEQAEGRSALWPVFALAAVLVLPLCVALVGFREPTWTPVLDLAQTELRVRDVGTSHTPLIGLPGRIRYDGYQGSHPGPLTFYALAPTYKLLGSSAFALQVATVVVHAGAIVVALLLARRRGGTPLLMSVAAMIAVLIHGLGMTTLTEPWNPYLPLLWWIVVLLAVWCVVCGDVAMLPVAVAAGSFCAQAHIPYLALSIGLAFVAGIATFVRYRDGDATTRRQIKRWAAFSVGLGAVLWLPPLLDQVQNTPGNLAILFNYFTQSAPTGEPVAGLSEAGRVVLQHFDLLHLSAAQLAHPSVLVANDAQRQASALRGGILLLGWAVAALVAWRRREHQRTLVRLHLVIGVVLALMLIATSRIYGEVWYYLTLSTWAVAALMALLIIWTAVVVLTPRLLDPARWARVGMVTLVVISVVLSLRSAQGALDPAHSDGTVASELHAVVPGTVAALEPDKRYLLRADDAAYFQSPTYGMLNELDRRGFDVGLIKGLSAIATPWRVASEDDADARIQIATGKWVDEWRKLPGAREVAFVDPRTPEEKARFDALHEEVETLLTEQGHADVIPLLDVNLFSVAIQPGIGKDVRSRVDEMLTLGVPMAVFVAPLDVYVNP